MMNVIFCYPSWSKLLCLNIVDIMFDENFEFQNTLLH